jgi:capsular exopolysaccharide synthesis family protein
MDHRAPDDGHALLGLMTGVRKHWAIVLAMTVLAAGIGLVFSKSQPRIYQAVALLEFDPNPVRPLGDKTDPMMAWSSYFESQENYETQFKLITSNSVLSAVVRDLGLQSDATFLGRPSPPPQPIPMEDATAMLRARVTVEPIKNSRLFYVKVEDGDPRQAQRLCDAIARTYIEQNLKKSILESSDAALWLNGQVDHYRKELEQNENELHEFKKRNDLPSSKLEEVSNLIRLEMQSYDQALTITRTKKQELAARSRELSKVTVDDVDHIPASELLSNAYLTKLRGDYLAATKERQELLASGKGDNHPLVKTADEKIASAKKALVAEVRNIQGALERDLDILARQEAGEAALYEEARKRAVELNLKELEYHRIDRQREQNEKLYAQLLERLKEADLARMMNVNNVRLVDPPTLPKGPIRPVTTVNVAIATAIGLVLGLALAVLREQLDSSLKTPSDVENKLGLTFLGMLPSLDDSEEKRKGKRRRRGDLVRQPGDDAALFVHQRPLSGVAEAARSLRTNLLFMSPDRPYRTLLVTSSAPAEGKTTVACSIAIAMAQGGHRVCIVDCDLRRPRLHRIFGRPGDDGVTAVLIGEASLDDVIKPARAGAAGAVIPNLWCIPAGSPPPNPADLLHSEKYRAFLQSLLERFDRVIVDSPPLAAVTDSAIISTLVDATVFVARAFGTSHHLARQGLRSLRDVDAKVAGAVLNAVDLTKGAGSYYYQQYYYYRREGYGPTGGDTQDAAPAPPN